jgi:hypothetical protein
MSFFKKDPRQLGKEHLEFVKKLIQNEDESKPLEDTANKAAKAISKNALKEADESAEKARSLLRTFHDESIRLDWNQPQTVLDVGVYYVFLQSLFDAATRDGLSGFLYRSLKEELGENLISIAEYAIKFNFSSFIGWATRRLEDYGKEWNDYYLKSMSAYMFCFYLYRHGTGTDKEKEAVRMGLAIADSLALSAEEQLQDNSSALESLRKYIELSREIKLKLGWIVFDPTSGDKPGSS